MTSVSSGRVNVPSSAITYRVGGREYPLKTVRSCKVCMSPYRFDIEDGLVNGRTYRKIVESLPEDHDLTSRNVADHYGNNHLPLAQTTHRQIVEQRAMQLGKSIEDGADSLVDGITLAQVVVQKAFEAIAAGERTPDVREGLAAAKILAEMGEYDEGGADMNAVADAFMVYQENAQAVMSPEQFAEFGQMLSSNPVLKALAARYDGEPVEGEVLDNQPDDEVLTGPLDSDGD